MTLVIGREKTFTGENFAGNRPRVNYRSLFPSYGGAYITSFLDFTASATTHSDVSGTERISAVNDDRIGYGIEATQTTAGQRPEYVATGGPDGRPVAKFVSSRADEMDCPDENKPGVSDHFVACMFKAPANGGGTFTLIGSDAGDPGRNQLRLLSTGVLVYNVGTDGTEAAPNVPRPNDTWCLAFGSWQESTERARVELLYQGAWLKDSDVQVGAILANNEQLIGRDLNNGYIAFVITGHVPILEASSDGDYERLHTDIISYARDRRGFRL